MSFLLILEVITFSGDVCDLYVSFSFSIFILLEVIDALASLTTPPLIFLLCQVCNLFVEVIDASSLSFFCLFEVSEA